MISHNNKKRTWHRAAALLLSASLLLTACGAQNNNDNIFSPILPDNSPASSTDPDDKLPDPVTIVVEDDSVAPAEGMVRSRLTNEWVDADVAATRPIAVMIPNEAAAIPQYSLSEASILYEANVENRMTRMMAVYEGWDDLDKIGNIRSLRDYYAYWAFEWDAFLVHFGGPFSSMNCWHSRTRRISTVPPARMKEPFPHHRSQQASQCLCFRGRSAAGDRPKRLQSGISWAVRRRAFPFCHEG